MMARRAVKSDNHRYISSREGGVPVDKTITKAEGDALARFLELIDNKWLAQHGCEERVTVRYVGPRDDVPQE